MEFELMNSKDLERIDHLQPDNWSDIIPEFDYYLKSPFCTALKKEIDNKIIAVGASVLFGHTSWIAHIIVDEAHRKKGIGYTITEDLLIKLDKQHADTCLLIATELGRSVYEKLGFKAECEYLYFKRNEDPGNLRLSDKIRDYKDDYFDALKELDKMITGEDREELLLDKINTAKIYTEDDILKGFYLPDLGEGPIIAKNEAAGIELMKLKFSADDYAVIPEQNQAASDFLIQNGFYKTEKTGTRMVRGKKIKWRPECIFNRIGGNYG
jgi:GNAT superfamily N-acetyltransferase